MAPGSVSSGYVESGLDPSYDEFGHFSFDELESLEARVERDVYFDPTPIGKIHSERGGCQRCLARLLTNDSPMKHPCKSVGRNHDNLLSGVLGSEPASMAVSLTSPPSRFRRVGEALLAPLWRRLLAGGRRTQKANVSLPNVYSHRFCASKNSLLLRGRWKVMRPRS